MVDQVGNRLGPRAYYDYTADDGQVLSVLMDKSVADAVGNTPSTGTVPKGSFVGSGIVPRYALFQLAGEPNVKKRVVITEPDSGFMTNATSASVAINSQNWSQTYRSGERRSMVPAVIPEPETTP